MHKEEYIIGFVGELKRGKSTLINALLGREVLRMDVLPSTQTPAFVRWGEVSRAEVCFQDGSVTPIPVEKLAEDYVPFLESALTRPAHTVSYITVYDPSPLLKGGIVLVDLPGLNNNEEMEVLVKAFFPKLDGAIMVLAPDCSFCDTEEGYVRSLNGKNLAFVVNKIDQVRRAENRPKVVSRIRQRIAQRLGNEQEIILIPVCALDALDGKLENDPQMVAQSGIKGLEDFIRSLAGPTEEAADIPLAAEPEGASDAAEEPGEEKPEQEKLRARKKLLAGLLLLGISVLALGKRRKRGKNK